MKKNLFVLFAPFTLAALFASCTSILPYSTNEIKAEHFVMDTYLNRDDYVIIGTATGTSDFVGPRDGGDKYVHKGDSCKYGYIFEPSEPFVGEGVYVGTGRKNVYYDDEDEALTYARLNANYELIESAFEMGGDSIVDPIYTVQTKVESGDEVFYKVTVRAKVIQINKK